VEISFDIEFLSFPETDGGRHGGVFYGAPTAWTNKAFQPTISWSDRKIDQGFHVYGNVDSNKAYGMTPGDNPDKSWKIIIKMDGTATFSTGPRQWMTGYTPKITGQYIGFWAASGNVIRIANYRAVELPLPGTDYVDHEDMPKTNKNYPGIELEVYSDTRRYGDGVARFFYSEVGGEDMQPKCVYLEGPNSLRTLHGSVYASEDLYAGRSLVMRDHRTRDTDGNEQAAADGARMYFIKDGMKRFDDDSLYLGGANFVALKSHIFARQAIRAGAEFQVAAKYGQKVASLWYDETAEEGASVKVKHGDFSTQDGSLGASNVQASEYLELQSSTGHTKGSAKFWYSQVGESEASSETLYLTNGDFVAATGSVLAAKDLGGQAVKIGSSGEFEEGEATVQYVKSGDDRFGSNTVHVMGSSFSIQKGSIKSAKSLNVGRSLFVSSAGDQSAELWYSRRSSQSTHHDRTLYLRSGDFATETGSIEAAQDVFAHRYLQVGTTTNRAQLWHSSKSAGDHEGNSLYLKEGDFHTDVGDIHSSDLVSKRYVSVRALNGFGEGKASLYYTASSERGEEAGSLYLKDGDFRVESGSVISANVKAGKSMKIGAKAGFGAGEAKLWYVEVPMGSTDLLPKTVYLDQGDFSTHGGSISAAHHMQGQAVRLSSRTHGTTPIELWYGKEGGELGALKQGEPHIVYLRSGDFKTEDGDLVAKKDIRIAQGSLSISSHPGYGETTQKKVTADLWYSHVGGATDAIPKETLHLKEGDFHVQAGNLLGRDVVARKKMKGVEVKVNSAKCGDCHFEKIYLTSTGQQRPSHALKNSLVLLDESTTRIDVGVALSELTARKQQLLEEQHTLRNQLKQAHKMVLELESRVQARRLL
jgi:hypothetical protein